MILKLGWSTWACMARTSEGLLKMKPGSNSQVTRHAIICGDRGGFMPGVCQMVKGLQVFGVVDGTGRSDGIDANQGTRDISAQVHMTPEQIQIFLFLSGDEGVDPREIGRITGDADSMVGDELLDLPAGLAGGIVIQGNMRRKAAKFDPS